MSLGGGLAAPAHGVEHRAPAGRQRRRDRRSRSRASLVGLAGSREVAVAELVPQVTGHERASR